MLKEHLKAMIRDKLPEEKSEHLLKYLRRLRSPIRWGNLRNVKPINDCWGFGRGLPVDRYYINAFIEKHKEHIKDRVLEIAEPWYIDMYGGGKVTKADILHVSSAEPPATMVGNLETGEGILENTYDCAIVTQTLQFIYDVKAGIQNIKSCLKDGGIALVSMPGISRMDPSAINAYPEYWKFNGDSVSRLFKEVFGKGQFERESFGNVLVAVAFLEGIATEDLKKEELDYRDPTYEIVHLVKAVKG